ncbi:winged helix-turn-helix domain-containing protein [Micromonospora sp. NPDC020750]|uniref:winged helix-turn-helix domain-containing protein n=1 Tax=unclassified Micromonospora TaxID=2617518 RepID=UPI0037AF179F
MIYPQRGPSGYLELADLMRAQITSGQLRPGARLPSEATLAQTYGVASKTARAALQQLRTEGLAEAQRGRGVVVRAPVIEPEMVWIDVDDQVSARTPTPADRERYGAPEGVPLLVVIHPDGLMDEYPAHAYRLAVRPS